MNPKASILALATAALVLACGPIPGGSLRGRLTPPPKKWSETLQGDRAICEIEARPEDPHSIQLECFERDGALYVQSHRWALAPWWPVKSWAAIWIEHPEVRVRIDDAIFELQAVREADGPVRQEILEQRGYHPVPDGIVLFRFDPRS